MSYLQTPKKLPFGDRVIKFIGNFEDLFYDGATVMCRVCKEKLLCRDKRDCNRHVNSVKHKSKKDNLPLRTQFMFDLLLMLSACDVPLNVLDKQPFREFWKKYVPEVPLPGRTTLRNYLRTVRTDLVKGIKSALKNTRLWLCIDETTDCKKHSILNVIVRVLDPGKYTPPVLLASKRLTECNGNTITRVVLETLEQFELSTSQVVMFMTNDAPTMLLVGRLLSKRGCRFLHVTCKMHALHLVAETIRQCFPNVDALIAGTKNVFLKSPNRLREFHSRCPGIPEPPQPILTDWGTWLKAAFYYAEHFQQIKAVILQFNPAEAAAIRESQTKFQDKSVEIALKTIHRNYRGLYDAIQKLQNSALSLAESLQVVDEVNSLLQAIGDAINEPVRNKFESVLKKDTGFTKLRQICDGASTDPLSECKQYFNYACITSVDVERSFSKYKHIFSPQRTRLSETTIETYLMLQSCYDSSPVRDSNINQATSSS